MHSILWQTDPTRCGHVINGHMTHAMYMYIITDDNNN